MAIGFTSQAQVVFETIVPENPVIVGEAFPVQFVLKNLSTDAECKAPSFKNFRMVGPPSVHKVNSGVAVKNTVYTLEAVHAGRFTIEGASINYNGTVFRSNNAIVEVITKAEAFKRGILIGEDLSNNDLYLKPGEDPNKKISDNLFVKLLTDRQSCYVGEPVTATFKLYSRLESSSDIVKNPGFYGFTVHDIVGLKDNKITKETVNGKQYAVHIIRKAQLYPLKAGALTIDEMEIENTVVFTDSPALRKVNQQIIEGVVEEKNKGIKPGTHEYTSSIHTVPVTIQVKDIPVTNKPADFAGAIGLFTIQTHLGKTEISTNEESEFVVTIAGKGNFTQLTAPVIQWPAGIEGFEPTVEDSFDDNYSPLKGSRTFHYPFVVAKAGNYLLPGLKFAFFNPDTNTYKQATAKAIFLSVKKGDSIKNNKIIAGSKKINTYLPVLIIVVVLIAVVVILLLIRKNKRRKNDSIEKTAGQSRQHLYVKEVLQPALAAIHSDDAVFYASLRHCIWAYLSGRLGVSSVSDNAKLSAVLAIHTNEPSKKEIFEILAETETHTYGGISSSYDKEAFYQRSLNVLEKIDADIKG